MFCPFSFGSGTLEHESHYATLLLQHVGSSIFFVLRVFQVARPAADEDSDGGFRLTWILHASLLPAITKVCAML